MPPERKRTAGLVPIAFVAALVLALPAPAGAARVVGIADQDPGMFDQPRFQRLDVPVSRLIVSYDAVLENTFEVAHIDAWMERARRDRIEPLVAFNHARGCYDGTGVVRDPRCRLPSVARYRDAFRAFRERYPDVDVYSPWNEVNHRSQPTARKPRRAARFYNVVRADCRGCTVLAADVLDDSSMVPYLRRFRRHAKGAPRLWGLHNYKDTNDRTRRGTRRLLRTVRGKVWLTETGGIVKFGRRKYNPKRAARSLRYLFRLVRMSRRIKRVYVYQWTGQPRSARFDAGLTHPDGRPRPGYRVMRRQLRRKANRKRPPAWPSQPPPPAPPPSEPPPPEPPPPDPEPDCLIPPLICPPG